MQSTKSGMRLSRARWKRRNDHGRVWNELRFISPSRNRPRDCLRRLGGILRSCCVEYNCGPGRVKRRGYHIFGCSTVSLTTDCPSHVLISNGRDPIADIPSKRLPPFPEEKAGWELNARPSC
ncbi:hypothetical protein VTN00DRAFT_4831 [Thermoascus crustaceus]|uniref:uncharacterized protein n=1 Tax=Thermoascus crustaceus TaxID=5088 RepID=UPI0037444FD1